MNWIDIKETQAIQEIKDFSNQHPVLIFKHSTRCSISSMAKSRLERAWNEEEMKEVKAFYLDVVNYRTISDEVASQFGVQHESPQALLIKDGKCIYSESHSGISYDEILKQATSQV